MEWLNEGVGLIVLISSILIILLLVVALVYLIKLRKSMVTQKLNFLGFYSTDVVKRNNFAELIIGNKSLNEVGVLEIGIRNGKVNFDLTELYREKKGIHADTRIVVEQRSSLRFSLTENELTSVLVDGKNGKELKTLRLYAIDLTGNIYEGKINAVRRLLQSLLQQGVPYGNNP